VNPRSKPAGAVPLRTLRVNALPVTTRRLAVLRSKCIVLTQIRMRRWDLPEHPRSACEDYTPRPAGGRRNQIELSTFPPLKHQKFATQPRKHVANQLSCCIMPEPTARHLRTMRHLVAPGYRREFTSDVHLAAPQRARRRAYQRTTTSEGSAGSAGAIRWLDPPAERPFSTSGAVAVLGLYMRGHPVHISTPTRPEDLSAHRPAPRRSNPACWTASIQRCERPLTSS
jgi:hypothetical protein